MSASGAIADRPLPALSRPGQQADYSSADPVTRQANESFPYWFGAFSAARTGDQAG